MIKETHAYRRYKAPLRVKSNDVTRFVGKTSLVFQNKLEMSSMLTKRVMRITRVEFCIRVMNATFMGKIWPIWVILFIKKHP